MEDWLDRFAAALAVEALTEDERRLLLALARDVAHNAERRYAPLSTFLAGVLVGTRAPDERAVALREAVEAAGELLG